jgi:hypothetical protein
VPVNAKKACGGVALLILNFGVVSFKPRPSCPRGNCHRPLLNRKLDGPQSRSGYFGEAEKFLSPAGILGYAARGLVIVLEKGSLSLSTLVLSLKSDVL